MSLDDATQAQLSGADHVHERKGFAAMLARIEGNGVRVVLVETASRFARDVLVQETGWRFLKDRGIDLIAVDSPGAFLDDTPTSKMIRQLLGVISDLRRLRRSPSSRGRGGASASPPARRSRGGRAMPRNAPTSSPSPSRWRVSDRGASG